jgi:hypothetical protein
LIADVLSPTSAEYNATGRKQQNASKGTFDSDQVFEFWIQP